CFEDYTILPILRPERPNKPCLTCTKQWCLDAKLTICTNATLGDSNPDTATGKEGDVQALCFQRDRPLDQMVVTLFLLTVFGLLLGAAVKGQLDRIGMDARARRQWWDVRTLFLRSALCHADTESFCRASFLAACARARATRSVWPSVPSVVVRGTRRCRMRMHRAGSCDT
ncbi:hypothetical protein EXIGLDRAFT_601926, partial [Exidia glandulosa HHB12029]